MSVSSRFRPSYRNIWGVSYPLIVAGISETVVDVTDTVFLAHYGMTELGAIALADAIYALALFMTLGLVDGIQISIGRRAGEGRPQQIGAVFNQGLSLLLITAVLLILAIKFLVPVVTAALFASEAVHVAVDDYLQIAAYGLLFHSFNLALSAFYIGISRTRVLIGATLTLAVTNIALDYALIFGNWGAPQLGIAGAAWATNIANAAGCLVYSAMVFSGSNAARFNTRRDRRLDRDLFGRMMRFGVPNGVQFMLDMLAVTGLIFIVGRIGTVELAATNVAFQINTLAFMPMIGFGIATSTL